MFQLFQFLCCRGVCCLDSILSGADVIVVCNDWFIRASTLCIECKPVETLVVVSQNTPPRATGRYITRFRQDEQPFLFGHEGNTRVAWPECGRVWSAGFHGLHMCGRSSGRTTRRTRTCACLQTTPTLNNFSIGLVIIRPKSKIDGLGFSYSNDQ